MKHIEFYLCARVEEGKETPYDLGFTNYTQEHCPRCDKAMWVGPNATLFRTAYPNGETICQECGLKDMEEHDGPIAVGSGSDLAGGTVQ